MGMDLAGPGYHINRSNLLILESKADMQKRGHASPDDGDALALTFAAKPATSGVLAITGLHTNDRATSDLTTESLGGVRDTERYAALSVVVSGCTGPKLSHAERSTTIRTGYSGSSVCVLRTSCAFSASWAGLKGFWRYAIPRLNIPSWVSTLSV